MPKRANHDGSVYQRADGYWIASMRLASGKRVTRSSKSKADADRILQELRKQDVRGNLAAATKVTLCEWFDTWMSTLDVRPSTRRIYTNTVTPVVRDLAAVKLHKLSPLLLSLTFAKLAQNGMGARQMSLGYGALRTCLDRAVDMNLVAVNPLLKVQRPKWEPRERHYWSLDETTTFLRHCETVRAQWAPLYIVLATCGLRISEALGLTWGDVNLDGRTIAVRRSLVWVGAEWSIGPLKTRAAQRVVSLPDAALRALVAVRPAVNDPGAPVFRSIHGNPPRHDQLHQPLTRLCAAAGVPRLHVHGLRHVAAALAYKATGDAFVTQRRLGHSSVATTMKIYAYLLRDDASTAAALDGLLNQHRRDDGETSTPE